MKKKSPKKAVALRYDQEKDSVPKVTAKGAGLVADKIIEIAEKHGIPVHDDPDLVEVLEELLLALEELGADGALGRTPGQLRADEERDRGGRDDGPPHLSSPIASASASFSALASASLRARQAAFFCLIHSPPKRSSWRSLYT